jgi:signal transduction histidine kinase
LQDPSISPTATVSLLALLALAAVLTVTAAAAPWYLLLAVPAVVTTLATARGTHQPGGHRGTPDTVPHALLELADPTTDVVFRIRVRPTLAVEFISPSVLGVLGISADAIVDDPGLLLELVYPDHCEELAAAHADGGPLPALLRFRHALDGRDVWIELRRRIAEPDGSTVITEGIARDVSGRRATEEALQDALADEHAAAERLRELDRMKSAFLSAVSHELRTPLASVLGFSETLRDNLGALDDEQITLVADRIAANTLRLDRLIRDLLDVERLMRGTVEPVLREVDVALLTERVLSQLERDDRRIVVGFEPALATVDVPKVERLVESLVVNADRHTPRGTTTWVRVRPADHAGVAGVLLEVEDDGPGIPEEQLAKVLEPFDQSPGTVAHAPGAGLGLSLVAQIARLHGGHVDVGRRPGGGAAFHVWLPAVPAVSVPRAGVSDPVVAV